MSFIIASVYFYLGKISKAPAGPLYEEVDLAAPAPRGQDIQMESNEAYGQVRSYNWKKLYLLFFPV